MKGPQDLGADKRPRWSPPDKEWLSYQYWTLEKSPDTIARAIGASDKTVRRWFKPLGVRKRTREQSYELLSRQTREGFRYNWRGGDNSAYCRRLMLREGPPLVCDRCGRTTGCIDVHHKDGLWKNNTLENLQWLCRSCHKIVHQTELKTLMIVNGGDR